MFLNSILPMKHAMTSVNLCPVQKMAFLKKFGLRCILKQDSGPLGMILQSLTHRIGTVLVIHLFEVPNDDDRRSIFVVAPHWED
jgi:hypothetical protein